MARFQFLLSWWSGQQLSPCLSFPMQSVTEQILARPYQRAPQRAEGEAERMLRSEQILREAANDHPRWLSLTLGLRRSHGSPSVVDQHHQLPCNFNKNHHMKPAYTESETSNCFIIIQGARSWVAGKWDGWLQGHWLKLAERHETFRCKLFLLSATDYSSGTLVSGITEITLSKL